MSVTEGPRRFNPLPVGHPAVGEKCSACHIPFAPGDVTAIVTLGPGDDPEEREKAREGRAYTAAAVLCHYACVTGED